MRQESALKEGNGIHLGNPLSGHTRLSTPFGGRSALHSGMSMGVSRQLAIGLILVVALIAFEIFNFDTTQYALADLLGEVSFMGLRWATILAIAFCFIDFAGLAYLFSPEKVGEQPKEVWYLMGAWLLGATMNALMTWWAVSVTLLSHDFGNEVLSRGQLLSIVPIFVAVLVWLTRILFIGAFSVAGGHLFETVNREARDTVSKVTQATGEIEGNPAWERTVPAQPVQKDDRAGQDRNRQRRPRPGGIQPTPVAAMSARGRRR